MQKAVQLESVMAHNVTSSGDKYKEVTVGSL